MWWVEYRFPSWRWQLKGHLTDLPLRYNLVNTVTCLTRITKNTNTLIDVIIINKKNYVEPATVIELGLSDHQAQVLPVLRKNHATVNRSILKRYFGGNNIREIEYLLKKETAGSIFRDRGKHKIQGFYELCCTFVCHSFPSRAQT